VITPVNREHLAEFSNYYSTVMETACSWGVGEVTRWLQRRGFEDLVDTFSDLEVDGDLLLQLSERDLKEYLGVKNGITRKRLWRELRRVMRNVDYSCSEKADMAQFLTNISSDLVEYTHKLVTHGLTQQVLTNLGTEDVDDVLKDAGIDNLGDRYKIKQAVKTKAEEPNVYLIYLEESKTLASLVEINMKLRGFSVSKRDSTRINTDYLRNIDKSSNVVLVLPADAGTVDDIAREELKYAMESCVNIVPLVEENFKMTEIESLLSHLVSGRRIVRWVHEYQNASMDRLESILRKEAEERRWQQGRSSLQFCKIRSLSIDSGIDDMD